jgi:hypothetical protein
MHLIKDISDTLIDILHQISDEEYCQPIAILEQQTIGQQVRHVVEHWQILVDNYHSKHIHYAKRKRDITIEQNKHIAIHLLQALQHADNKKDVVLNIVSIDESTTFTSSYFRELDVVTEHIIHHAAIIRMAILSLDLKIKIPANFGYAPSTISYKEQQCAQ